MEPPLTFFCENIAVVFKPFCRCVVSFERVRLRLVFLCGPLLMYLFSGCSYWISREEKKDYPAEFWKDICCELMKEVAYSGANWDHEATKNRFRRAEQFDTDDVENEHEGEDVEEDEPRTVITID